MKKKNKVWFALMFLAIVAVAILVVMLLWNWLIPSIIGWSAINYWEAAGLLLLSKLLFGGFGRHHRGWRRHSRGRKHMHHLSKEEKQELLQRWTNRRREHKPEAEDGLN